MYHGFNTCNSFHTGSSWAHSPQTVDGSNETYIVWVVVSLRFPRAPRLLSFSFGGVLWWLLHSSIWEKILTEKKKQQLHMDIKQKWILCCKTNRKTYNVFVKMSVKMNAGHITFSKNITLDFVFYYLKKISNSRHISRLESLSFCRLCERLLPTW